MSSKPKSRRPGSVYLEPDSLTVVLPAVTGALLVGAVSFLMSWDALRVVGRWAGIAPSRTWGLPLAMDASILVFSALWLIARRRGLSTWFHITAVTAFTLGSVGGNIAHALADGTGEGWQVSVGAVAAAAFPLTVFATTHAVAGLLVDPDADVRPARPAPTAARRARVQPQTAPAPAVMPGVSPTITATTPTLAPQTLPAPVRAGTAAGRQTGGAASVAERLEAVRALDETRPGLSERGAAAALCEAHGDPAWISRTTVARMRRRIAEDDGAGARGLVAVG